LGEREFGAITVRGVLAASNPAAPGAAVPSTAPDQPRSGPFLAPPRQLHAGGSRIDEDAKTLAPDEFDTACPRDQATRLPIVDPKSYRITGEVAQGGIGRILRARDDRLDRPVALKELLTSAGAVAEERFVREALLTARLQHPAIVPLYEAGRWPSGEPFYAMKYVSGRSFAEVILECRDLEQRLGLLPHVLAVAEAVAYAHSERIIHRDLKPSNILVGAFGETVVIDWGLAKDLAAEQHGRDTPMGAVDGAPGPESSNADAGHSGTTPSCSQRMPIGELTMQGAIVGTPAYMPPEQAKGQRVDERADVYALGAILYHLLAGLCPYDGDSALAVLREVVTRSPLPLEQRQKGIPHDLLTIVKKAMARDPADRYPSAKELAADLLRFQTGQIVAAHKYSSVELFERFARRYRATLLVGAAAFVLLSITLGLGIHHNIAQRYRAEAGEAAAIAAQRQATARADDLTLVQARAAVERDPNEALAWLKSLSASSNRWPEARLIAADAQTHGLATVLRGHEALINDLRFSPDGKLLATASDDHSARLWEVATGKSYSLPGHTDETWTVDFSPSGRLLASSSKDKTIRIWHVETHEPRKVLAGHTMAVTAVLFLSEDTLVSGSDDKTVRLWDLRTGQGRVVAENSLLFGAPRSADRKRLALSGVDGVLRIYDSEQGELQNFTGADSPLVRAIFSPTDETVASLSRDGTVRKWDLKTGESQILEDNLPTPRPILYPAVSAIRFSRDGKWLAAGGWDQVVRLWEMTTGKIRILEGHQGVVARVAFSPDSKRLATGSFDHTVRLWDLESGDSRVLRGFEDAVTGVAFSPDGKVLAVASHDKTVRLFPTSTTLHRTLTDRTAAFLTAAFSPDGKRLIVGGNDGAVRLWELATGACTLFVGHKTRVQWVSFSPNGELIASAGADHAVRVWDLSGREIWATSGDLDHDVKSGGKSAWKHMSTFSPDSRLLAAPGEDGTVQIVDFDSGTMQSLTGHVNQVLALAFSADGKFLASGGKDGTVRLWNLERGESRVLSGHEAPVVALAFSPDGKTLASGSLDHTLCLWNRTTGEAMRVNASGGGVTQIGFLDAGAAVLSLGLGETGVRLWDAETGRERSFLRGHSGNVSRFALSRDERRLTTSGTDGTVRIWDLASRTSRVLQGHLGPVWAAPFSPDGKIIASVGEDQTVRLWPDDLPEDEPSLRAWLDRATPETIDNYHHPAELTAANMPVR
jgi:WD40 repeat protein/serine/threonine protein kinase